MTKIIIDASSSLPVHHQLIEGGASGKEFLAYTIVTFFAGSFLYNSLLTESNWDGNTKLHEHIIDSFVNDCGWDCQGYPEYFEECYNDSPNIQVIW